MVRVRVLGVCHTLGSVGDVPGHAVERGLSSPDQHILVNIQDQDVRFYVKVGLLTVSGEEARVRVRVRVRG